MRTRSRQRFAAGLPYLAVAIVALLAFGCSMCALLQAQTIRAHQIIAPAGAAIGFTITDGGLTCNGACPTGTAIAINSAIITVESQAVRWWDDGSVPTAAVGHLAPIGTTITLSGHTNVVNFLAIATTGTSSLVGSFGRP